MRMVGMMAEIRQSTDGARIPRAESQAEYVEKRSRFIATLLPVASEEEALARIESLRKKYYDARHNCYAYIVFSEDGQKVVERSSDDGEPSGTAGRPILDVLSGNQIRNILVVVTRYFGGTLLGTGGLVRAYTTATKEAVDNADLIVIHDGVKMVVQLDYTSLGSVQYQMREYGIQELSGDYGDAVCLTLAVPADVVEQFKKELTQIFAGKEKVEDLGPIRYGRMDGNIVLL